jgi:alanine racemase
VSPIRALIDREALRANLRTLRRAAQGARVMAVIKANAYGHGITDVAATLASGDAESRADAYAVARLDEALELRAAGIHSPIVLLEGVFDAGQLAEAARHALEIVVHDESQLAWLEAYSGAHAFKIWLKVDTGMNRLGFRPEQLSAVHQRLTRLRVPLAELRLMTHLARADELEVDMTAAQVARFETLRSHWPGTPPVTSIGNSAGILFWPAARGQWVRPGISLYGVSPSAARDATSLGLAPVMSLDSRVVALRRVPAGETVGYGGSWQARRESRIAIVAAGYGDGVPRHLPSGTPVLIDGVRAPLAGRVSMDMIAVDVTDLPTTTCGSVARLWGPGLPVEEIAAAAGTIAYEVLCGVSRRVVREWV